MLSGLPHRKAQWIFDPPLPSGARQGGLAAAQIIQPELHRFVREVLQNACDQRLDKGLVEVRFILHELSGRAKVEFLDALGWDQLKPHVRAAAREGGITIGPQLRDAVEALDNTNDALVLLRIDDSGTRGLLGDEDDHTQNFNLLCRDTLVTVDHSPSRGGSFGIGKSVLWRFSRLSTVLFASRLSHRQREGEFRLFGRAELPSHQTGQEYWLGPGWFGRPEKGRHGNRAVSLWETDAESLAGKLFLSRPAQLGTGTSIVIVSFFEPAEEEKRDLEDVARDILRAASVWFWPILHGPEPRLKVVAEVYRNNKKEYSGEAEEVDEVKPFLEALRAEPASGTMRGPGDVARVFLRLQVPARKDPPWPAREARVELRVRYANETDSPSRRNQLAYYRGAGMVVGYKEIRVPLAEHPFHAVLRAGLARGDEQGDEALEAFLRAAEPPGHDEWKPGTDRLHAEYGRGARARLDELWRGVQAEISRIIQQEVNRSPLGAPKLAELFRLGGRGGGHPGEAFRVDSLAARFDGKVWRFQGRVTKMRDWDTPWSFSVSAWLDAETGRGEAIPVTSLVPSAGKAERLDHRMICRVPAGRRQVMFEGEASGEGIQSRDLRLTRLRIEVQREV